jgi:hypothetical protein
VTKRNFWLPNLLPFSMVEFAFCEALFWFWIEIILAIHKD